MRAGQQTGFRLLPETFRRVEPAFKRMAVMAVQIIDNHFITTCNHGKIHGARSGGRTRMIFQSRDFKSLASTYFAIRAFVRIISGTQKRKRESTDLCFPFMFWSGRRVSNSRPQPWQGCALPTELLPHQTWRRDPESNWTSRICNPVHNRFAIAP